MGNKFCCCATQQHDRPLKDGLPKRRGSLRNRLFGRRRSSKVATTSESSAIQSGETSSSAPAQTAELTVDADQQDDDFEVADLVTSAADDSVSLEADETVGTEHVADVGLESPSKTCISDSDDIKEINVDDDVTNDSKKAIVQVAELTVDTNQQYHEYDDFEVADLVTSAADDSVSLEAHKTICTEHVAAVGLESTSKTCISDAIEEIHVGDNVTNDSKKVAVTAELSAIKSGKTSSLASAQTAEFTVDTDQQDDDLQVADIVTSAADDSVSLEADKTVGTEHVAYVAKTCISDSDAIKEINVDDDVTNDGKKVAVTSEVSAIKSDETSSSASAQTAELTVDTDQQDDVADLVTSAVDDSVSHEAEETVGTMHVADVGLERPSKKCVSDSDAIKKINVDDDVTNDSKKTNSGGKKDGDLEKNPERPSTYILKPPTQHSFLRKEIAYLPNLVGPGLDHLKQDPPTDRSSENEKIRQTMLGLARALNLPASTVTRLMDATVRRTESLPAVPTRPPPCDTKEENVPEADISPSVCITAVSTPNLAAASIVPSNTSLAESSESSNHAPVQKKVSDFPVPKRKYVSPFKINTFKKLPKHMFAVPAVAKSEVKNKGDIKWTQVESNSPQAQMPWISKAPRFDVAFPPLGARLLKRMGSIECMQEKKVIPQTHSIEILKLEENRFPGLRVRALRRGQDKYSFDLPKVDKEDDNDDQ